MNLDTGTQESVADSELNITEDFAIMFTISLPVNHHYNATIRAGNGAGTEVTFVILSEYRETSQILWVCSVLDYVRHRKQCSQGPWLQLSYP